MKLFHTKTVLRPVVGMALLLAAAGCLLFGTTVLSGSGGVPSAAATAIGTTVAGYAEPGSIVDASKVMGYKACVTCHKSEIISWMQTKHAKSELTIRNFSGNVQKYCEALEITKDKLASSICAECHATPKASGTRGARIDSGISCESCHGPSGSEQGWLNRHAVYGPNGSTPENETPKHFADRVKFCEKAGMVRAASLYNVAKNCQSCHTILDEELVNAGHKSSSSGFELVGWSTGEVRHNFHQNQADNSAGPSLWKWRNKGNAKNRKRVMFLVGKIVNIEIAVRGLSKIKDPDSDYAGAFMERTGESFGELVEMIGGVFEDEIPEDLAAFSEDSELAEKIGALTEDTDFSEEEGRKAAATVADEVAKLAQQIAKRDGSKLEAIGELMEDLEVKGEAYSYPSP